jgi:hypothetical protein
MYNTNDQVEDFPIKEPWAIIANKLKNSLEECEVLSKAYVMLI